MQSASSLPAAEYAQRSDPGRDPEKQVNEDACDHRETRFGHLCVVCDGMGGHAAGREASELALATILEGFEHAPDGSAPAQVLRAAIEEASRRVHSIHTSEVALGRPGSTVVAVLMHAQGTEVAHVGDSRAYLVHEGQVFRLTRDHSVVQELVDRGLLTPQQAARHPDANRITRALGMGDPVDVEVRVQPVPHVPGDAFVLCSDGLSDLVSDEEILTIVGSEPAAQAVGKLVDLANARGGYDNVTVVVLRAREGAVAMTPGLAPTVAQTSVASTRAVGPSLSAAPTLLDPPRPPQATEPAAPLLQLPVRPDPVAIAPATATVPGGPPPGVRPPNPNDSAPPPPSSRSIVPGRRAVASPVLVLTIVLAILALALVGAMMLSRETGRHGRSTPLSRSPSFGHWLAQREPARREAPGAAYRAPHGR